MTSILHLVGHRFQESHNGDCFIFESLTEFLAEPKTEEENDEEESGDLNVHLRQLLNEGLFENLSPDVHRSTEALLKSQFHTDLKDNYQLVDGSSHLLSTFVQKLSKNLKE